MDYSKGYSKDYPNQEFIEAPRTEKPMQGQDYYSEADYVPAPRPPYPRPPQRSFNDEKYRNILKPFTVSTPLPTPLQPSSYVVTPFPPPAYNNYGPPKTPYPILITTLKPPTLSPSGGTSVPPFRAETVKFGTRMRSPNKFYANYPIKSHLVNTDQRLEFPTQEPRDFSNNNQTSQTIVS